MIVPWCGLDHAEKCIYRAKVIPTSQPKLISLAFTLHWLLVKTRPSGVPQVGPKCGGVVQIMPIRAILNPRRVLEWTLGT